MRKLLLILLLASPCFGAGPKHSFQDPLINDELINVYKDIKNPQINYTSISSATISSGSITNLTVTNINGSAYTAIVAGQLPATATNDNAAAGKLGEYLYNFVGNVPATSGVYIAISTITLTAGDWDVSANCLIAPDAGTVVFTVAVCYVTATPGNNTTGLIQGDNDAEPTINNANNGNANITGAIPAVRVSVAGSTPYYLKIRANWTTSTVSIYGRISARRVR